MLFAFTLLACQQLTAAENTRPIIGIMSQPNSVRCENKKPCSYLAASYVKYVESAGARAVPILYNSTEAELRALFPNINGVLFPGGGASLSKGTQYRAATELLYNLALESNDKGTVFPIWGTCLGFELLHMITAQDDSVLSSGFKMSGPSIPLNYSAGARTSRLFQHMSDELYNATGIEPITLNSHESGVSPNAYETNSNLPAFYDILSTNLDPNTNRVFVSTVQSKKYPIFATQWHPEKNNFEWKKDSDIHHTAHAVSLSQYMANFLVGLARQNDHSFSTSSAEEHALIYNFQAEEDPERYFDQVYIFK